MDTKMINDVGVAISILESAILNVIGTEPQIVSIE
jgi:hypothetical protein